MKCKAMMLIVLVLQYQLGPSTQQLMHGSNQSAFSSKAAAMQQEVHKIHMHRIAGTKVLHLTRHLLPLQLIEVLPLGQLQYLTHQQLLKQPRALTVQLSLHLRQQVLML